MRFKKSSAVDRLPSQSCQLFFLSLIWYNLQSEYANEYLREEHERYHREHGESAKSARANNTKQEQNNLNTNINNNPNEQKPDNKPEGGSAKSCPNHSDEKSITKTGVESTD